jgi:hypothetical protein
VGRALAVAALAGALVLGACGSGSKKLPPGEATAADAEAQSNARSLQTQVEACFVDTQSYAKCRDSQLKDTVLHLGSGKGQVTVAAAGAQSYTIRATSKTGNTYTIARRSDGASTRTCHAVQQSATCTGGRW